MKQCKEANNHLQTLFRIVQNSQQINTQSKFISLRTVGNGYLLKERQMIARNCIYICHCYNIRLRDAGRCFYDMFRPSGRFRLMGVINLINATGVDASLIFNHDLITEAVESDLVVPGFNPNTYKLSFDLWEWSKPDKKKYLGVPEINE